MAQQFRNNNDKTIGNYLKKLGKSLSNSFWHQHCNSKTIHIETFISSWQAV